ncbi:MAG: hypothetical protein JNN03_02285 [Rubrivivax sp.]|nr:hypothetical protein [Rubrivivax sp.]
MSRLAPMPGTAYAGMDLELHAGAHPATHRVLMPPAQAGWITMPRRWVHAVRESAPRVAAPVLV